MTIIYDNHMMIINDHHHICHLGSSGVIWESSGRHLGDTWESFGIHLGSIWEPFGRHLETSGRMEAEEASGGQISYYMPHSRTECKSSIKISISRGVFDGTINYDCIFTATSVPGKRAGSRDRSRALYQDRENPIS